MRLSRIKRKSAAGSARQWQRISCWTVMAGGLAAWIAAPTIAHAQDTPKDVPPTHWAYQAVEDLAQKGLIKGYPPDGKFLGGRTLTRYEMATIIQRVVARFDDLLKNANTGGGGSGVSKEDIDNLRSSLAETRKLVDDFKVELTVIGTDLNQVKADLADLKAKYGELEAKVNSFDQRITDVGTAVDQALENINELKNTTNAALAKKVDVGTGKLRIGGLFQAWYMNALGDTPSGNLINTGAAPPIPLFGGPSGGTTPVGDTFRLRRGEISFNGSINNRVDYKAMFDIAKVGAVGSSILQDLWVGYQVARNFRAEVGQQKTGLSEEGTHSSAELLLAERSILNSLPATIGRIGDIRDTGVMLKYNDPGKPTTSFASGFVGLFNGNNEDQNTVDADRGKFLDFGLFLNPLRHLTLGVWGGMGVGDTNLNPGRDRLGGTLLWQSGPHLLEIEGAYTRDLTSPNPGTGTIGRGGYVMYAHTLSRKFQLVGRFDNWDPNVMEGDFRASKKTTTGVTILRRQHQVREYTVGVNYYIQGHKAKIQLNYIRVSPEQNAVPLFGRQREIILANYQVSF